MVTDQAGCGERTLVGQGEVHHHMGAFLLFSAILLKDIKCILSSPNILYPSLLGAEGSNDSGTCPRSRTLAGPSPVAGFLAQNASPLATIILP